MATERLEEIESVLAEELEAAKTRLKKAKQHSAGSTPDIPTGNPPPDGVPYIPSAAEERDAAVAAFATALRRFNNFAIYRIIPQDLDT